MDPHRTAALLDVLVNAYTPTYITYIKILAQVLDHIQQFYGQCRTLHAVGIFLLYMSGGYDKH